MMILEKLDNIIFVTRYRSITEISLIIKNWKLIIENGISWKFNFSIHLCPSIDTYLYVLRNLHQCLWKLESFKEQG